MTPPKDDDARALIEAARLAAPRDVSAAAHLMTRSLEFLSPDDPGRKDVVLELLPLAIWGGRPRHAENLARIELASAAAPQDEILLRMCIAESVGMQDRWSEAAELWSELLENRELAGSLRLRARAEHALSLGFCRKISAARTLAHDVLAAEKAMPDDLARYLAMEALFTCLFFEGRCEEAAAVAEDIIALTERSTDVRLSWRNPQLLLGVSQSAAGHVGAAETVLRAGREFARRTGTLWAAPACQCYLAVLFYRQGRWKEAVAESEEGLRLCETSEATWELATLLGNYAVIEARRGAFQRAEKLIERFDLIEDITHGDRAWKALAVSLVAEGRGDRPEAYHQLAEVWREARKLGVSLTLMLIVPDLLRLAMDANDRQLAEAVVEHFATLEKTNPESQLTVALSAHSQGVVFERPEALEAAITSYRAAGHEPHEALAWEELAIIWAEAGRPRKALTALREALNRFDAMGAVGDGRRARARLRWREVFAPPPAIETGGGGSWGSLTKTEKVVAGLVAEGLKNQEIAERLFVSVQTVQTHLKNIFKKLGASSRSQVVREVLGQGDELEDAFGTR